MTTSSHAEQIDEMAARWTSRLDGGDFTESDRRELHAWLNADPAHRVAFERYQFICDDTAESIPMLVQTSAVAHPDAVTERAGWKACMPVAAGLAAALALGVWWGVDNFRKTPTVATAPAQRSKVELPDGTRAQLNAATRLHTDFRRGQRVVRLEQGEAYFSVVKDAAHPFRVETAGGTVTVLGTQFNVRLLPGGAVEVTLFEGGVDFERAQTHVRLSPGQQISESGPARVLSEGELAAVAAWRDGRIRLNGLTLAGAAARFATFHGKQIAVAPDAASIEMGGSYSLDDLAGFFDTLSGEALGLRVVRIDADHYTIARK